MNRAQRRAAQRHAPPSVPWVADNYRRPDCLSENSYPAQDEPEQQRPPGVIAGRLNPPPRPGRPKAGPT